MVDKVFIISNIESYKIPTHKNIAKGTHAVINCEGLVTRHQPPTTNLPVSERTSSWDAKLRAVGK